MSLKHDWIVLFLFYLCSTAQLCSQEVLIHLYSMVPHHQIQKTFEKHLKNTSVQTMENLSLLKDRQKLKSSPLVVASSFYEKIHEQRYQSVGQFILDEKHSTSYTLVSLNAKWDINNIRKARVGLVDESGRRHVKAWMQDIFGKHGRRHKRTSHPTDLVPLLVLDIVDVIVVRKDILPELQERFSIDFKITGESKDIPLPKLYQLKDHEHPIHEFFNISEKELDLLGYSSIEKTLANH